MGYKYTTADKEYVSKIPQKDMDYIKKWTPKCRYDFPLFCEKMLGITLGGGQTRLEEERRAHDEKMGGVSSVYMILAANRFGKSVYEGSRHIWKNYYKIINDEVNVLPQTLESMIYQTFNSAPSSENTKVILQTILKILRSEQALKGDDGSFYLNNCRIGYFVDLPSLKNYETNNIPNQGPFAIRFANGSVFRAFTMGGSHGDKVQGTAFMYSTYDEFGRSTAPEEEIDDLTTRLIDFKGELDIITTPDIENEASCAFIMEKRDLIEDGLLDWFYFEGSSRENAYTDLNDLAKRTQGMSEQKRLQITEGRVGLAGSSYFEIPSVVKLWSSEVTPQVFGQAGHVYYIGLDTAGTGQDYWAINVVDITTRPWKRVFYYYDKHQGPHYNIGFTKTVLDRFINNAGKDNVFFVMDKTNEAGSIYYADFADYSPIGFRFGIEKGTGKSTKAELLDTLRRCINEELIICTEDRMLKNQLVSYKGPSDDKKQTTDALMSFALSLYYPYREYVYNGLDLIVDI